MAIVDDTAPPPEVKAGPSLVIQIAALVGLTVVAIAIGWLAGLYLSGNQPDSARHAPDVRASETTLAEAAEKLGVIYLEPVTTNLAGPSETWVRLELALVFADKPDAALAQTVQQDILAYLRTVKVHQIEGASGFQHLKSDIEERASIRSEGKVRGVLFRTLLFE